MLLQETPPEYNAIDLEDVEDEGDGYGPDDEDELDDDDLDDDDFGDDEDDDELEDEDDYDDGVEN